jgi:hypothetical protein
MIRHRTAYYTADSGQRTACTPESLITYVVFCWWLQQIIITKTVHQQTKRPSSTLAFYRIVFSTESQTVRSVGVTEWMVFWRMVPR